MKYELSLDKDLNIVVQKFEGEISPSNLRDVIQESYEHPDWDKCHNVLCDLREAKLVLSGNEMRQVITSYSPCDKANKLAIIVSGELEFGMAKIFELIAEETPIWDEFEIFKDIDEAKKWLRD